MIRVLLVDDSKFLAKALRGILKSLDFEVVAMAHDGVEALEQFKTHSPEVVLLDVTMPNMDGVECLTQLMQIDPEARVVMLSAIQDEEVIERCLALGACSFLKKPIVKTSQEDLDRLSTTLQDAFAKVA